jgi:hypothetical protein
LNRACSIFIALIEVFPAAGSVKGYWQAGALAIDVTFKILCQTAARGAPRAGAEINPLNLIRLIPAQGS